MTPAVGDTVSWLVYVCSQRPDDERPVVHQHRRYGRVVEVIESGVLVDPLLGGFLARTREDGVTLNRDSRWQLRDLYIHMQPGGELPVWLCDGQYRTEDR